SLPELAERMRDIDIAMLSTHTENGQIASRPMSNNRDVDYDGDSFYFTFDQSRTVSDIRNNPKVTLAFQSDDTFYATVEGEAKLFTDKPTIQQHWQESLNEWFPDGPETEGVVMIQVNARRIKYWDGLAAGEVKL
ncbi:MAG: pyridoxamine 5'-phosphate oxidase, partial [Rubrivivax sp.]